MQKISVSHKNDNEFKKGANSSCLAPSIRSLLLFVVVFVRNYMRKIKKDQIFQKIWSLKGQAQADFCTGFCTLPDRKQRVQTFIRLTAPFTTARTCCKFGYQRRLVLLLAWLTLWPTCGPFPQISQRLDILSPPFKMFLVLFELSR